MSHVVLPWSVGPQLIRLGTISLCFAFLAGVSGPLVQNANSETVTFFDGTFNPENWELSVFFEEGNGGFVTSGYETTGGNPGEFRLIGVAVFSAPPYSRVVGFHRCIAVAHNPATHGRILSLDYYEDSILLFDGGGGQGAGPALEQDGFVFVAERFDTPEWEWTPHLITGLVESDFHVWDDPTHHPDFSENGSPIVFGFHRGNSTFSGGYATVGGIDNWTVTLETEAGPSPVSHTSWGQIKATFREVNCPVR